MRRPCTTLAILMITIGWCAAADSVAPQDPPKLTPTAQAELDRFTKVLDKLKIEYCNKAVTELDKCRQTLKKALVTATKAGDLNGALAIQAKLKEMESTALLRIGVDEPGDPLTGADPIIGTWKQEANILTFTSTECSLVGHADAGEVETGTYKAQPNHVYLVAWPWGDVRITLDSDHSGKITWPDGLTHALVRTK